MYVDKSKTYIGIVEDNSDPKKLGRCRVRVVDIFDNIPVDDIPWASPWKDLNGNAFNVPEKGKILTVVFDSGNIYKPEYIYADHYNINLENKLKSLSDDDYKSMKAVLFDQSTQIYRTTSGGLKIDHEFSNINLDKYGNILFNLRDDKSVLTVGSPDADESMVLGTTFMDWMDTLIDNLSGGQGGPYLDSSGAPVLPNPSLVTCLSQYEALRNQFLSDHAKISKNGSIISQNREHINQVGDNYKSSSQMSNSVGSISGNSYSPESGYKPDGELEPNPAANERYDNSKDQSSGQPPNTPYSGKVSDNQRNAIRAAVSSTLSRGSGHGKCARYTYNHASNYIKALRSQKLDAGASRAAGGNARDGSYHENLSSLGWKKIDKGRMSKSSIMKELDKDYDIGDIIIYWGLDGSRDSYARYGHTQVFTGGLNEGSNGYRWSTDNNMNYKNSFVYKSKGCDEWQLIIMKSPTS